MPLDRSKGVSVSKLTKHPGIFKPTYWGVFSARENPGITDQVITNRNDFVKQYEITEKCMNNNSNPGDIRLSLGRFSGQFDHLEFYNSSISPDCVVMVNSPYYPYSKGDVVKKQLVDKLVSLGFTESPPLYLETSTVTVIMTFSRKNLVGLRNIRKNWDDKPEQLLQRLQRPTPEVGAAKVRKLSKAQCFKAQMSRLWERQRNLESRP